MTPHRTDHACRLMAVGDIMLHGRIYEAVERGTDPLSLWSGIAPLLAQADLVFGNLETMVSAAGIPRPGTMGRYRSPAGTGQVLARLGFSFVNIGHNHALDWGAEGVACTTRELDAAGVAWGGIGPAPEAASRPAYVCCPRCGRRFAFVCFTATYNTLDPSLGGTGCAVPPPARLRSLLTRVRNQADVVVVSIHGGACLNPWPSPQMLSWCRGAAAAGADIVLGHHAHISNGLEVRAGRLIAYALPDCIRSFPWESDEAWERMVRPRHDTFILDVHLPPAAPLRWEIIPCILDASLTPRPARGDDAERIQEQIATLSHDITTGRSTAHHYAHASRDFGAIYGASLWRTFRTGGLRWLVRRIITLRPYHLGIVVRALRGQVRSRRGEQTPSAAGQADS